MDQWWRMVWLLNPTLPVSWRLGHPRIGTAGCGQSLNTVMTLAGGVVQTNMSPQLKKIAYCQGFT